MNAHSNWNVGGAMGSSVICTELHRQGLMDDVTYKADEEFGKYLRKNNPNIIIGYHFMAKPVVKLMQKSKFITKLVSFIAMPWAKEMAYEIGRRKQGDFFGKILMKLGLPICQFIGNIINGSFHLIKILQISLIMILIYLLINFCILLWIRKKIIVNNSLK